MADALESAADVLSGTQRCNRFSFAMPPGCSASGCLTAIFKPKEKDRVRVPAVPGLDKRFVRKNGFSLYIDLHIIVNGELSVREGHRISHLAEENGAES